MTIHEISIESLKNKHMDFQKEKNYLASLIIDYKIVNFNFEKPATFKSGILSPIYCDFRKTLQYPGLMKLIGEMFCYIIPHGGATYTLAGVATGAIPHATYVAQMLEWPLCYVRPGATEKAYGLKKKIEGAEVVDDRVYLIEDLISTGGSVLADAQVLKSAGAARVIPLSIFSYEMKGVKMAFRKAKIEQPVSLITLSDLLPILEKRLSKTQLASLKRWMRNPNQWKPII